MRANVDSPPFANVMTCRHRLTLQRTAPDMLPYGTIKNFGIVYFANADFRTWLLYGV
jgi:hypothetical protein